VDSNKSMDLITNYANWCW